MTKRPELRRQWRADQKNLKKQLEQRIDEPSLEQNLDQSIRGNGGMPL